MCVALGACRAGFLFFTLTHLLIGINVKNKNPARQVTQCNARVGIKTFVFYDTLVCLCHV